MTMNKIRCHFNTVKAQGILNSTQFVVDLGKIQRPIACLLKSYILAKPSKDRIQPDDQTDRFGIQ
ncbi:hypothetical protein RRF57_005983 [Xylaria bambusicola]|uniref:Uncharacterized protein n=1 Tax=Xylaria bambusicola TaxID=326684 RepID=A0AAN7UIP3_9PEZI